MQTPPLKRLYEAPFTLHQRILEHIDEEIRNVQAGGAGHIIAKLNALVEPEVIRGLYRASAAGVMVDLVVRGICCLRPGVPGISENIRVRSIVGRFLEHARVYYFYANGEQRVFCSSADWMDRNFFRRVEACFPILDEELKARLLSDLDLALSDNSQAWELQTDGSYVLTHPPTPPMRCQSSPGCSGSWPRPPDRTDHRDAGQPQPHSNIRQELGLALEVSQRQRACLQPRRRQAQRPGSGLRPAAGSAAGNRRTAAMEQHRQSQQDRQAQGRPLPAGRQRAEQRAVETPAVGLHHPRDHALLFAGEARHVGVLEHVGTVAVVMGVGDVEAQLVQLCPPGQDLPGPSSSSSQLRATCSSSTMAVRLTRSACA
jgi:hypothetical protein